MSNFERSGRRPIGRALIASLGLAAALTGVGVGLVEGVESTGHTDSANAYKAQLPHADAADRGALERAIADETQAADDLEHEGNLWLIGGFLVFAADVGYGNYMYYRDRRGEQPGPMEVQESPA